MNSVSYDLYGAPTGNCVRVAIAFEEAGLRYTAKQMNLAGGEHRAAPFLALNPVGKVPVVVEHDPLNGQSPRVITQSNAILFYLAGCAPDTLLPTESSPCRSTALERYFYFLTDVIAPSHAGFALRADQASIPARQKLDERVVNAIAHAERFAADSPFLSGDRFGLADIAAVTIMDAYRQTIPWDSLPALSRWYEMASTRPSVVRGKSAFHS
jgi:GSH-dependent disulfide-bond oxidoreductase